MNCKKNSRKWLFALKDRSKLLKRSLELSKKLLQKLKNRGFLLKKKLRELEFRESRTNS